MTEATQRRRLSAIDEALRTQAIELPSWAFGNSGTRFKVFSQQGIPRDPFGKIAERRPGITETKTAKVRCHTGHAAAARREPV